MNQAAVIAVVLKGYPRLSETFIAQEILALEEAGFQLQLISLRHPTDSRRHTINDQIKAPILYLPEYLRDERKRVATALWRQMFNKSFWRALPVFFKDYMRDPTVNRIRRFGQATVLSSELIQETAWLYAHFIHTPGSVARYASIMRGLPVSFSAHAKDIWTIPEWEISEKLMAGRWTVCCTKAYCERLKEVAPDANVQLLYHGIDLKRFPDIDKQLSTQFHIVSVARAVDKKGLDTLLQALSALPKTLDWRFSHIGGGPDLDALEDLSASLGIADKVNWLRARSQADVIELLGLADVFCLPARLGAGGDRDGLPNAIMEALSQKVPVIATPIGGIQELIDETCGVIVQPDAPDQITKALIDLAQDPDRRQRMGLAGRQKLQRHFSFDQNIIKLVDLFKASLTR